MRNGNGTLLKIAMGVAVVVVAAGIVGGVTLGREVAANSIGIERNTDSNRQLRTDINHRLDRIEERVDEVLRELRK